MVITDKTEQNKRREKSISVLCLVPLFPSNERVKGFFWAIKIRNTAHKSRWKFASQCWCAPGEEYSDSERKMKTQEQLGEQGGHYQG